MKKNNVEISIFFLLPNLGGGSTTYTAHLFKSIEAAGGTPKLYRVKKREEGRCRPFADYDGVEYRNIDLRTAKRIVKNTPSVLSAPAPSKYLPDPDLIKRLCKLGMRVVIHDPNEFKIYDHLKEKLPTEPICIRPTMKEYYPNATWIPHPYLRCFSDKQVAEIPHSRNAVSIARIASVKRPKILLEANRKLKSERRIDLKGAEHRLYTRSLEEKYGDVFKQSGKTLQFPLNFYASPSLCSQYKYNVDMTWFPDDGGGTQYAQMEAMDAGCVNIMHEDWFRYDGELKAGKHVLTVSDHKDLCKILRTELIYLTKAEKIIRNGFKLLKKHDPEIIGKLYLEELVR